MMKLVVCAAVLVVLIQGVYPSCWSSSNAPDPSASEHYCIYNGAQYPDGASFMSGAPGCDDCHCNGTVLYCCKYGYQAGVFHFDGCEHVTIEGSCELNLVRVEDHSQPCST